MIVTGNIIQKYLILSTRPTTKNSIQDSTWNMYWYQRTLKTQKVFMQMIQGEFIHRMFYTPKKNYYQNQTISPQLELLTETTWYTPDQLTIQAPPHLQRTSYYWRLLSDESQVDYWWQNRGKLACHKFFNIDPAEPLALHLPENFFPRNFLTAHPIPIMLFLISP